MHVNAADGRNTEKASLMKIARIDVYNFELTYIHGVYRMSGGRDITSLPSTLVRVTSDDGHNGWGEVCPLGTTYLPAHAEGARAALRLMAPSLIGIDPTNLAAVNDAMDAALMGYAYAKSPVDVACWDLTGKVWGRRHCRHVGRRAPENIPALFRRSAWFG